MFPRLTVFYFAMLLKNFKVLFFVCVSALYIVPSVPVSKGAVTEGFFILQNQMRAVQETIQDLKQELTCCYQTINKTSLSPLEIYHCKLKQLIYPLYIDEISQLAQRAQRDVDLCAQKGKCEENVFNSTIRRMNALNEKLNLERRMLKEIFALDSLHQIHRHGKQLGLDTHKETIKPRVVEIDSKKIEEKKKEIVRLKGHISLLNAELFDKDFLQEVSLERLTHRKRFV